MSWKSQLNADPLPWLLEANSPGVRYLALRDLVDAPPAADLRRARTAAHKRGPIAVILRNMEKEGYWVKPGPGYNPKYRSAVWSMITLAQLGASIEEDPRLARACSYMLDHSLAEGGQFSCLSSGAAAGNIDCLQGNLCWALLELGCDDPRLDLALDWMARTVTGEGMGAADDAHAPRRYFAAFDWSTRTATGNKVSSADRLNASQRNFGYKTGPNFACLVNGNLPCAWGGVKVMLALGRIPPERRTPVIRRAMRQAARFFLALDPATAAYPTRTGDKPSRNWWKFGFPVLYVTDLVQLVEALQALGFARDRRLAHAVQIIRDKQDARGRWPFEFDYLNGKMWLDFGRNHQPNKWVTLRALRALKAAA